MDIILSIDANMMMAFAFPFLRSRINKLGSRSLSGKLNSSSAQGSTHSVTWSLELVTIIAMPPTTHHQP